MKDSLTADNRVVRLLTSPCGAIYLLLLQGRGLEFCARVSFLEGKSEGRCMSHILISADTQTFSQSEL